MIVRWLLVCIATLVAAAPAGASEDAERDSVVRALAAYHAALEAGDTTRVSRTIGPSFFMADEKTAAASRAHAEAGAGTLSAHLYLEGEALRAWPGAFLREAGPYRNAFEVQSVSLRGDAAVVVTRDRGRNRFRSWEDEETVWFLGRMKDRWRVVGMIVRDIQLPERPPGDGG